MNNHRIPWPERVESKKWIKWIKDIAGEGATRVDNLLTKIIEALQDSLTATLQPAADACINTNESGTSDKEQCTHINKWMSSWLDVSSPYVERMTEKRDSPQKEKKEWTQE